MKAKSIVILLIVISILSMSFCVKAATGDKYDIVISANNTTLKAGDTVTLSLKIDNINIFKEFFKSIKNKFKAYSL